MNKYPTGCLSIFHRQVHSRALDRSEEDRSPNVCPDFRPRRPDLPRKAIRRARDPTGRRRAPQKLPGLNFFIRQ
jgi:hypothetical protein